MLGTTPVQGLPPHLLEAQEAQSTFTLFAPSPLFCTLLLRSAVENDLFVGFFLSIVSILHLIRCFKDGWEKYVERHCFIENTYFARIDEQFPDTEGKQKRYNRYVY